MCVCLMQVIRNLMFVWVSHHHADHFTGVARVLVEYHKLQQEAKEQVGGRELGCR